MSYLLHGSYFGYNFGDTLLCRLFSEWMHGAGAKEVNVPLANERNRSLIGADRRGLLSIRGSDGLVLCGGGYFSEPRPNDIRWTARAYLRHILLINRVRANMRYAILGVGVGPISSARLRRDVVAIFEQAETVVVRDPESAQNLYDWGVRRGIDVEVDAVVTASKSELLSGARTLSAIDEARIKFGGVAAVHVTAHPSKKELAVAQLSINWFAQNTKMAVVLANDSVPRVAGSEWSQRISVPESCSDRIVRHTYTGEPGDLVGILDAVDVVVTTKLHVGIVRCSLQKPVISVPSHSKTPRFYRQMGLEEWCVQSNEDRWQENLQMQLSAWRDGLRPDWGQFEAKRAEGHYQMRINRFLAERSSKETSA